MKVEASLSALIGWLEKQPPETKYDWRSVRYCLIGRYITAVTGNKHPEDEIAYDRVTEGFENYIQISASRPWTFGAALDRAKTVLARIDSATICSSSP